MRKDNEVETDRLKVINSDMMKYIAVIPMAIGHFMSYMYSAGVITDMTWWVKILTYCSLFAPIIFFFFITEGFKYTRSKKKFECDFYLVFWACCINCLGKQMETTG